MRVILRHKHLATFCARNGNFNLHTLIFLSIFPRTNAFRVSAGARVTCLLYWTYGPSRSEVKRFSSTFTPTRADITTSLEEVVWFLRMHCSVCPASVLKNRLSNESSDVNIALSLDSTTQAHQCQSHLVSTQVPRNRCKPLTIRFFSGNHGITLHSRFQLSKFQAVQITVGTFFHNVMRERNTVRI